MYDNKFKIQCCIPSSPPNLCAVFVTHFTFIYNTYAAVSLYYFLLAVTITYQKVSGSKQNEFIILYFYNSEVWHRSHWAKQFPSYLNWEGK